jgi:SH3-like domain-containing protein
MNLIKEKEGWLLVESNNMKGWIKKDDTWGLN